MFDFFTSTVAICCCGFIFVLIVIAIVLILSYQAATKKSTKQGVKKQGEKEIQYEDAIYRDKDTN